MEMSTSSTTYLVGWLHTPVSVNLQTWRLQKNWHQAVDKLATNRRAREKRSIASDQRPSGAALSDFCSRIEPVAELLTPISEREYVQRALDLANWTGQDYSRFRDLEAAVLVSTRDVASDVASRPADPDHPYTSGAASTGRERAIAIRDLFRKALQEIAADIQSVRRAAKDRPVASGQVIAIPVMRLVGRELEIGYVFWSLHVVAALNLIEGLLLDRQRRIGDDLRQCRLATCGQLFLLERKANGKLPNGPPRKYHDSACMKAEHDLKAPKRVAESRDRRDKNRKRIKRQARQS